MNKEDVRIVKQIRESVTNQVECEAGDNKITANVTTTDGKVSAIDGIVVRNTNGAMLFEGWANPNIGGSFLVSGCEAEIIATVSEFVETVKS